MDRRVDALVASAFVAVGVLVLYSALTLPESSLNRDAVGPAGLPVVLAAVFIVGGTLQTLRSTIWFPGHGSVIPPEGAEDDPEHPSSAVRPLLFIAGSFAYVAALHPVGYLVATPIAIGLGLWVTDFRPLWLLGASAVGFTIVSFMIFSQYLGVPVPTGILTELLVDLGVIDVVR